MCDFLCYFLIVKFPNVLIAPRVVHAVLYSAYIDCLIWHITANNQADFGRADCRVRNFQSKFDANRSTDSSVLNTALLVNLLSKLLVLFCFNLYSEVQSCIKYSYYQNLYKSVCKCKHTFECINRMLTVTYSHIIHTSILHEEYEHGFDISLVLCAIYR